jgi:hypothetical protein
MRAAGGISITVKVESKPKPAVSGVARSVGLDWG